MSTICRDCEAIVVADDDVPADLVRIAMANHERFCKPGRREICDICDDVDFITSSGETNIHAVLSGMTVCAHDDYDWPCPTYNIVATERTPEDDNR